MDFMKRKHFWSSLGHSLESCVQSLSQTLKTMGNERQCTQMKLLEFLDHLAL